MFKKTVFAMTATALCLSLSNTANALLWAQEATQILNNTELGLIQLRQIEELKAAMQLLETANISSEASEIMRQMELLSEQTGYIIEERPPAELTTCESTMSTRQFRARMDHRNDYSNGVSVAFSEILADLSNGEVAITNLSNALTAAGGPSSPISATQADVLAQAAQTVAEQRESTKTLMKNKEDQIEAQLSDADSCAIAAHNVCVMQGQCPEGESLSAAEEQARYSPFETGGDIGGNEVPNSGALLGTDGTAMATLYEVQMDGSLKVVKTYPDADGPASCAADLEQENANDLSKYFKCE